MSTNIPVVNAGLRYINGLGIAKSGDKTLTLDAGSARNSTNVNDIMLNAAVTIDGSVTGANGVDVAALVANTFYAVYLVGDSTKYQEAAGLLSLDAEQPALPSGYDMYRRVGWVLTDGSANILEFLQFGDSDERTYYYDVAISVLTSGTSLSFAEIDLSSAVPSIDTEVAIQSYFTAVGATDLVEYNTFGSVASDGVIQLGTGVAADQVLTALVPAKLDSDLPKILYKLSQIGDSLDVKVFGYKDYL